MTGSYAQTECPAVNQNLPVSRTLNAPLGLAKEFGEKASSSGLEFLFASTPSTKDSPVGYVNLTGTHQGRRNGTHLFLASLELR